MHPRLLFVLIFDNLYISALCPLWFPQNSQCVIIARFAALFVCFFLLIFCIGKYEICPEFFSEWEIRRLCVVKRVDSRAIVDTLGSINTQLPTWLKKIVTIIEDSMQSSWSMVNNNFPLCLLTVDNWHYPSYPEK